MKGSYHQQAQTFIKSAKSKGYNVTADNGELIASKKKAGSKKGSKKPKTVSRTKVVKKQKTGQKMLAQAMGC